MDKEFYRMWVVISICITVLIIAVAAYNYFMGCEYVRNNYEQVQVIGTQDYRWQKVRN